MSSLHSILALLALVSSAAPLLAADYFPPPDSKGGLAPDLSWRARRN